MRNNKIKMENQQPQQALSNLENFNFKLEKMDLDDPNTPGYMYIMCIDKESNIVTEREVGFSNIGPVMDNLMTLPEPCSELYYKLRGTAGAHTVAEGQHSSSTNNDHVHGTLSENHNNNELPSRTDDDDNDDDSGSGERCFSFIPKTPEYGTINVDNSWEDVPESEIEDDFMMHLLNDPSEGPSVIPESQEQVNECNTSEADITIQDIKVVEQVPENKRDEYMDVRDDITVVPESPDVVGERKSNSDRNHDNDNYKGDDSMDFGDGDENVIVVPESPPVQSPYCYLIEDIDESISEHLKDSNKYDDDDNEAEDFRIEEFSNSESNIDEILEAGENEVGNNEIREIVTLNDNQNEQRAAVAKTFLFVLLPDQTKDTCPTSMFIAKDELQRANFKCEWLQSCNILKLGYPNAGNVFVLHAFEGIVFESLRNHQAYLKNFEVFGPYAVQSLLINCGLSCQFFTPIFSFSMKGLNILIGDCVSQSVKMLLKSKIKYMGGAISNKYDPRLVTHVIVENMRDPLSRMAGDNRKPIMSTDWVTDVWREDSKNTCDPLHAVNDKYMGNKCLALQGIRVFVGDYGGSGRESGLRQLVVDHGGTVVGDPVQQLADVVVSALKVEFKTDDGQSTIPCFTRDWILDSIQYGYAKFGFYYVSPTHPPGPASLAPQTTFPIVKRTPNLAGDRKFVILLDDGLPRVYRSKCECMAKCLGNFKLVEQYGDQVTHVVIHMVYEIIRPTYAYLNALIDNKFIITPAWIDECYEEECLVKERDFETYRMGSSYPFTGQAKPGIGKIFHNLVFKFNYSDATLLQFISVLDWKQIIKKLGGIIYGNDDGAQIHINITIVQTEIGHVAVIDENVICATETVTRNVEWIIRCILHHKLVAYTRHD